MADTPTYTILNSLEWSKRFVYNRQLSIGNFKEPLLSSANIVMQTILGPPFRWRFNRQTITFSTVANTQDYTQACTFGFIETASVNDGTKWYEMSPKINLALDATQARPTNISAQVDDLAGNITFRLMPVPDKVYQVSVTIQKAAPLITSLNQTWSPIPDNYAFIYQIGLLSYMYEFADDPRWAPKRQQFVTHLLGAAEGLSDTERNIFLNQFQSISLAPIERQMQAQQGTASRGTY